MTRNQLKLTSSIIALVAMISGMSMARADQFAHPNATQGDYSERVRFNDNQSHKGISTDVIKALYNQSMDEVITESKQLVLLQSVYNNDVAHGANDQLAEDQTRIEQQKIRLLRAQRRAHGYALAIANNKEPGNQLTN